MSRELKIINQNVKQHSSINEHLLAYLLKHDASAGLTSRISKVDGIDMADDALKIITHSDEPQVLQKTTKLNC